MNTHDLASFSARLITVLPLVLAAFLFGRWTQRADDRIARSSRATWPPRIFRP